jgi:hypothetical protein
MNLLLLIAASASMAQTSPYYYCEVTRPVPFGNVTVLQYVNTTGESEAPVTTWFAERAPDGTVLLAAWHNRSEMADSAQGGEIFFGYTSADRALQYRVEVAPFGQAASDRKISSELLTIPASGIIGLRTHWGPVAALLAGGVDLEVRVLLADGTIVRRDRVGAAEFGQSLRIAGEIQPEFEAMIADYRARCRPIDNNGHH